MTIKSNPSNNARRVGNGSQPQKSRSRPTNVASDWVRRSPFEQNPVNASYLVWSGQNSLGAPSHPSFIDDDSDVIKPSRNLRQKTSYQPKASSHKRKLQSTSTGLHKKRSATRPAGTTTSNSDHPRLKCVSSTGVSNDTAVKRNSEDEYEIVSPHDSMPVEQLCQLELRFRSEMRDRRGLRVKNMRSDGNCLFRAIADQVYGDEELHLTVRRKCMDHIAMNQASFCQYLTEDFDSYIERKRRNHEFGNYVEMIALSEVFRRSIELYHYGCEPSNTFCGERANVDHPMRISFHIGSHYNSIEEPDAIFIVPFSPEDMNTGPFLKSNSIAFDDGCGEPDPNLVIERDQIEQAMLDDKLRATDCEATDAEILQTVAQTSYFEWLEHHQLRHQAEMFQILEDIRQKEGTKSNTVSGSSQCQKFFQTARKSRCIDWSSGCNDSFGVKRWPQDSRRNPVKRTANGAAAAMKKDNHKPNQTMNFSSIGASSTAKRLGRKTGRTLRSPTEGCAVKESSPGSSRDLSPISSSSKDSSKRK